jgi:hypothetical protein
VTPKERDAATAKLMSMDYRITFFDAPSLIKAIHLSDAKPSMRPLKTFIQQFSAPNVDLKALIPIFVKALVPLYREPLLPESRCRVATALFDTIWNNLTARRGFLDLNLDYFST